MQRLKLPAWKVGDRVFESRSGIQVSKKQNAQYMYKRHFHNVQYSVSQNDMGLNQIVQMFVINVCL